MNKNLKSQTVAIFPVLVGLQKLLETGVKNFKGVSMDQEYMLSLLPEAVKLDYSQDEVKSLVSHDAKLLNNFLKDNGFDIYLPRLEHNQIGVVTLMNLMGSWLEEAGSSCIDYEHKEYQAAVITKGASIVNINEKQVLKIITSDGLCVFIEKTDEQKSGVGLFRHIYHQAKSLNYSETPCHATVPLLTINDEPNMEWLLNMVAAKENEPYYISKAIQQNHLDLSIQGIIAESATVVYIQCFGGDPTSDLPEFIVDQPFNIWISYDNPDLNYFPLFGAFVAPDSWKEPVVKISIMDSIKKFFKSMF